MKQKEAAIKTKTDAKVKEALDEKKAKKEHEEVRKAKAKAQQIKAKAHENKSIDKKVSEQRELLKDDVDKIRTRTETAVESIMADAKDTIEKLKNSQPGYEEEKKKESDSSMSKQGQ